MDEEQVFRMTKEAFVEYKSGNISKSDLKETVEVLYLAVYDSPKKVLWNAVFEEYAKSLKDKAFYAEMRQPSWLWKMFYQNQLHLH